MKVFVCAGRLLLSQLSSGGGGGGGGALFSSVPGLIHGLAQGFSVIPSLLEYSQSPIPRLQLLLVRETLSDGT